MRGLSIIIAFALFGCGSDKKKDVDAAVGNDDSGGGVDMMPDTPGGNGFDCTTYCTKIMAACTAANAQYGSMANCVDSCANFPMGMQADMTGNTLGCRINHANLAVGDPATHCVHAGPGGGGACGMPCAGFCTIVVAECPTQWTMQQCNNQANGCPSFATTPPYHAPFGTTDTLECRLYHATMAATDPTNHCSHTDTVSPVCNQ